MAGIWSCGATTERPGASPTRWNLRPAGWKAPAGRRGSRALISPPSARRTPANACGADASWRHRRLGCARPVIAAATAELVAEAYPNGQGNHRSDPLSAFWAAGAGHHHGYDPHCQRFVSTCNPGVSFDRQGSLDVCLGAVAGRACRTHRHLDAPSKMTLPFSRLRQYHGGLIRTGTHRIDSWNYLFFRSSLP